MKPKKLTLPALLCVFVATACCGCLPESYDGGKNRFGNRWEAVVEKDAPAETLFSRLYFLKQLPPEDRQEEYKKALERLKIEPDVFWHLETVYLAILTGHSQQGAELLSSLKAEIGKPKYENDPEIKGVVGLMELLLKQKIEIHVLEKTLQAEKEKSDKLAHQLKELKNIEKIIHERETKKENE